MNNIEVFKDIKESSKIELKKILKERQLARKEILFNERDIVDKVYFLKTGKISIFKMNENGERKVIFILRNGEMINEVSSSETTFFALFDYRVRFVVDNIRECRAKDFIKVMEDDFALTKNILVHTQNTNRRLYRQLKNSISIRIDKKLASKLYRIGKEFGVCKGEWTLLNVNLTITYIADMLGCKRESLSRAMKILQDENLVKIEGKKVYIKKGELSSYFKST